MNDPWNSPPHIRLDRYDIASFPLSKIRLLQHLFISPRLENPIEMATHLLLQSLRVMCQTPQLRRGRLFHGSIRLDSCLNYTQHSLQSPCGTKRLQDLRQPLSLAFVRFCVAFQLSEHGQHDGTVPQLTSLQHSTFRCPIDWLTNIGKA